MDLPSFLPQVGLFRGLNDAELSRMLLLCRLDSRGPGELIFAEGDDAVDLGVVMEGRAELRFEMPGREAGREQTIFSVFPGKAFGWSALTPPFKLTLSVYGGEHGCRFFRVNGRELMSLFEEDNHIGFICLRNLAHVIAKRFHALEEEVVQAAGLESMCRQ
ncbi:MAG: cyclic nucleotide-binding domain-containing protein [Pseudomonadota bacterium]